jgi:Pyridine nucleotide-disulphide oxidoreductase
VNPGSIAIVGAGPYGLSLAAHLASRGVGHRIFGHPMLFWSQIAKAGSDRYLKSFCFGTNISAPKSGYKFADYSRPRGLETFEPCSIADFAAYGAWFQEKNVSWLEQIDVKHLSQQRGGFGVTLANGESLIAKQVVIATGLSHFADVPSALKSLPPTRVSHTSEITSFAAFKGKRVAVIGGGQSALEAAALLHESGAHPRLIVRERSIAWNRRTLPNRNAWQRLRSPIASLGSGPKAWALSNFPGAVHRFPADWRTRFVKNHLPAEGAWWLRHRVEGRVAIDLATTVVEASSVDRGVVLSLSAGNGETPRRVAFDSVIAGTGYQIDIRRLPFLDRNLQERIACYSCAPKLNSRFESSVPRLRFIGPSSAMCFGPLFRFVAGVEYTSQVVSTDLHS